MHCCAPYLFLSNKEFQFKLFALTLINLNDFSCDLYPNSIRTFLYPLSSKYRKFQRGFFAPFWGGHHHGLDSRWGERRKKRII